MRRYVAGVGAVLLLAGILLGAPPKLTVPAEVRPAGQYAEVLPEGDCIAVTYIGLSSVDPIPSRVLNDKRLFLLDTRGLAAGRYKFAAVGTSKEGEQVRADFVVVVRDAPIPPGPNPPEPPVPPTPTPTGEKWLIMVWESEKTLSKGQASVTTSAKVRNWVRTNLKKTGGLPDGEFIFWDKDTAADGYPKEWQDRWARYKSKAGDKPMMFYSNGVSVYEGELPDDVDKCLEILNKKTADTPKPVAPEGKGGH